MKKLISAALASILAVSAISTAAFADDTTLVAEGIIAKPAIKVTMPKSMAFVFNPYGLAVDAKGKVSTEIDNGKTGGEKVVYNNGIAVPSYIFDEATRNTGWIITNNTAAPITAGIVATCINEASATFLVLDKTDETKDAATTTRVFHPEINVSSTLKSDGTYDFGSGKGQVVYVHSSADVKPDTGKSIMTICATGDNTPKLNGDHSAAAKMPGTSIDIPAFSDAANTVAGTLCIQMKGTIANAGSLAWLETDAPKITYVYAFELAGGLTPA